MEIALTGEQESLLKHARDTLGRLRDTLSEADAPAGERTALAESIRQLDELFLLVVAGEFNAGKSAFVNALVGRTILQEGVTPTTSQIHLLKYGPDITQTPHEDGVWLHTAPVPLLKNINIVDTPGTNAIHREHEALTTQFIPRSDLVLFITSSDRPFTESERQFLTQIREWGKKIVLVVNKIDILNNQEEIDKVLAFVNSSASQLLGSVTAVFPVSGKLAQKAKSGEPRLWSESGFEPLESYIQETLDDDGRFRLKLLNPLGVGDKLVKKQLGLVETDLASLKDDSQLLDDIHRQMNYYDEDMQRNFKARLGEIDNIVFEMERRGNAFFDDLIRIGRIPDLIRAKQVEQAFTEHVVADASEEIEHRVGELVDWMVEQDLRQWSAVADHLARRKEDHVERVVGQSGPREGTLAYDRQRLIDSIGTATRKAVETYDKEAEAEQLAASAREAVVQTGLAGVGVGLGVAMAIAVQVVWVDVTGIVAGVLAAALGMLVLPSRRRRAKQELADKLANLRQQLMSGLRQQFDREMRRGTQRIEDTIAPFDRFVRAESDKISSRRDILVELEAHVVGLRRQLGERV